MDNKIEQYRKILSEIKSVLWGETDYILIMSAIAALLKSYFGHFSWVGFYRKIGKRLLSVGPYQGEWGCLHIKFGQGVCGKCVQLQKTILVPDVTQFPGYIACNNQTKSEIVIPVFDNKKNLIAVLDIDSYQLNSFDTLDKKYLEEIVEIFPKHRKSTIKKDK